MMKLCRNLYLVCATSLLASPAAAMHPAHPEGFSPEKAYQMGLPDQVDLFSGSLSVRIPIGPLTMTYGSSIWTYRKEWDPAPGEFRILVEPNRKNTGGLGWTLGWGEVFRPGHWYNPGERWMYVDQNGGRHVFYQQLHRGEDDGDSDVLYTRDGSYLRLRLFPSGGSNGIYKVWIEHPDGSTRSFVAPTSGGGTAYNLTRGWSAFASEADPDFSVDYVRDEAGGDRLSEWILTDRWGRVTRVHSSNDFHWLLNVVTSVELPPATQGAPPIVYDFFYDDILVSRSCKDTHSSTGSRIRLPHLKRIDLPDGTSWKMKEGSELLYENLCSPTDDAAGVLTGLILPSGAKLAWDWQRVDFPAHPDDDIHHNGAGVEYRRLYDRQGVQEGEWRYQFVKVLNAGGSDEHEMRAHLVYPTGDCTKHYFDARYKISPSLTKGWRYGLPGVQSESLEVSGQPRYLSSKIYASNNGAGSCSGTKLRSTYVDYRRDQPPATADNPADWHNLNRNRRASHTVFHDDGERWVDQWNSSPDGLGRFRRVETRGNFWPGQSSTEYRKVYTELIDAEGVYPGAGYVPPGPDDPWVHGKWTHREVREPDAVGEWRSRVEQIVSATTGAVTCRRVLRSGIARTATDVLVQYTRDSLGQVTDVKTFGGDLQSLSTGSACGLFRASEPEFWVHHDYEQGRRVRTVRRTPAGDDAAFLDYDVDLDPDSGRVIASRDAAGLETTYLYDTLGRLSRVAPPDGAHLVYAYIPPSSSAPARVATRVVVGFQIRSESEVVYDDFGRVTLERQRMPDGTWSEMETLYNPRGWVVSVSEPGDPSRITEFLGHDPFGRPTIVRPPVGSIHDRLIAYDGIRRTTSQAKVATAAGEVYRSVVRESDRYGRLRYVLEASGAGGANVPTTYSYDVGNRLTEVTTTAGGSLNPPVPAAAQLRWFSYDNRGFLLAEGHPEKGVGGNGSVVYESYDSSGRAHRIVDGTNDLAREYDFLGRLTAVREDSAGGRLLAELEYDGAAGAGLGRLWRSTRHNWIDLPGDGAGVLDAWVRQTHSYEGLGGSVSNRLTEVSLDGVKSFETRYQLDDERHLAELRYPECVSGTCSGVMSPARAVSFTYDQGRLREVPGWTGGPMTYHPSGQWATLPHANGAIDEMIPDPVTPSRKLELKVTSGGSEIWNKGAYAYDGAGNVKSIGAAWFAYDGAGRLTEASVEGYQQSFQYDAFANLTAYATTDPGGKEEDVQVPVDPDTNRLTAATYDAAGNTVDWGGKHYDWDARNRLQAVDDRFFYLYDVSGERVAAIDWTGSAATREVAFTLRGLGGQVLSSFVLTGEDQPGNWQRARDWIWAGGRPLATAEADGSVVHLHLDHLGSVRLRTDSAGELLGSHDFLPYGDEIGPPANGILKFTGHERDAETGLDYMHARYYTRYLGRFLSVDPVLGRTATPQSWNRYTYVLGNPLGHLDPDGRSAVRDEARQAIRESGMWMIVEGLSDMITDSDVKARGGLIKATLGVGLVAGTYIEHGLSSIGIGFFDQNPYDLSLTDEIAFQLREEHRNTWEIPTSPPPQSRETGDAGAAECTGCERFYDSIDVVDDGSVTPAPGPIDPNGPGVSGDTPVSGTGVVCGSGNNCVQVAISGTAEEVQQQLELLETELFALESLNDLISGSCMVNPNACASGGGGGGIFDWMVIYYY